MSTANAADGHPSERVSQELLQLHLAEYQMLTTRCTYFIALHMGVWGVVVTVVIFSIQQWFSSGNSMFIWLGAAGVQALLHLWATILEEQYLAVSYIENNLRHLVVGAVPTIRQRAFWRYEAVVSRKTLHENFWGEWITFGLAFVGFVLVSAWRRDALVDHLTSFSFGKLSSIPVELIFAAANLVFLVCLFVRTRARIKVRRTFSASFKQHPEGAA